MKKLASILFALVMLMSMATTAFAASVTIPSDTILENHTFTAYQIFSGREENGILSDIDWGKGINEVAFLDALKADTTHGSKFADCTDAASVAQVLGSAADKNTLAHAVARIASKHLSTTGTQLTSGTTKLDDGYYLVVDTTENVAAGSAYNAALLQVVGNIDFDVKTDAPSVEKKVLENVKYNRDGGYGEGYNDVADYTMGEHVPFRLIGSVPDMTHYDTYKYIFHDTLSNGLDLNESTIKVYGSKNKDGSGMTEITTGWTQAVNGQSFTVSCTNLKAIDNISNYDYIIVEYTATLDRDAVVGLPGNPNTVHLEYSNKPDQSGTGENHPTGNTPVDKVIVFTYELDTIKIDGATQNAETPTKLSNAQFVLSNKIPDGTEKYAIVDKDTGKVTGWEAATTDDKGAITAYPNGSTLTSGTDGLFKVIGLDDGTYYLTETQAPAGYNMITSPIKVIISATTVNDQNWTSGVAADALTGLAVTSNGNAGEASVATGTATITVVNNSGTTLPETGGIGTSIFYTLGATLMLCAGVLLVTKKRMAE